MCARKIIKRKIVKKCSICARTIKVISYIDKTYRGGHYFGKIPMFTKKARREAAKHGFKEWKIGDVIAHVYKKDPKPYGHFEYWECPRCYWKKNY